MEFGIPKLRVRKTEKYPNMGVVTLFAVAGEGSSRRLEFNSKAEELLGLERGISKFSLDFSSGTEIFYIVNTSSNESIPGLVIGKTNASVSNKKYYEYIRKVTNQTDESQDLELVLKETPRTYMDQKVFELHVLSETVLDNEESINEMEVVSEVVDGLSENGLTPQEEEMMNEYYAQQEVLRELADQAEDEFSI